MKATGSCLGIPRTFCVKSVNICVTRTWIYTSCKKTHEIAEKLFKNPSKFIAIREKTLRQRNADFSCIYGNSHSVIGIYVYLSMEKFMLSIRSPLHLFCFEEFALQWFSMPCVKGSFLGRDSFLA
jgi:hypothetical protein